MMSRAPKSKGSRCCLCKAEAVNPGWHRSVSGDPRELLTPQPGFLSTFKLEWWMDKSSKCRWTITDKNECVCSNCANRIFKPMYDEMQRIIKENW